MGDKVQTWRVVLTDGGVHEVPVERLAEVFGVESYLARFRHAAAWGETPRLAVLRLAGGCFGEAVEIVSPDGNVTSDVHALRNERGVLLREVLRLRAENDMLRKSTDAAVDGVRTMLPAALKVAREEGAAAMLARCRAAARAAFDAHPLTLDRYHSPGCICDAIVDALEAIPLDAPAEVKP